MIGQSARSMRYEQNDPTVGHLPTENGLIITWTVQNDKNGKSTTMFSGESGLSKSLVKSKNM